jgi:hypothetical protein
MIQTEAMIEAIVKRREFEVELFMRRHYLSKRDLKYCYLEIRPYDPFGETLVYRPPRWAWIIHKIKVFFE